MNKIVYFLLLCGLFTGCVTANSQETCSECIVVEGSLKLNEVVTLKCNINQFNTGTVSWVKGDQSVSECQCCGAFCTKWSDGNKHFNSNTEGSVVEFRPLLKEDLGTTWQCYYQQRYIDSFTITIRSDQTNHATSDILYRLPLVTIFGCLIYVILRY